jgi:predicted DNA-binding transcriptional regulator YafY
MSKTENCLKMLQILNRHQLMKISEMAAELETSPRNVIEYRKELELIGYDIKSVSGRYGGYYLEDTCLLPSPELTEEEKQALVKGNAYLSERNDFMEKEEFKKAASKILSSVSVGKSDLKGDMTVLNRFPLAMKQEEIQSRYQAMQEAIDSKTKMRIRYLSLKNTEREHVFHPYKLFMYNNAWFAIGWFEEKGDVGYLKLDRIEKLEKTNEKFVVWANFNIHDYLDDFGFKQNGDWYHLAFIAKGPYASLVKERIYGRNQKVTPIDEQSTKVEVDMQNQENIRVFVLGFGSYLEVLEPGWLISDLKRIASEVQGIYKDKN